MEPIAIIIIVLFVLAWLTSPLLSVEDRPAFRWPDRKPRRNV